MPFGFLKRRKDEGAGSGAGSGGSSGAGGSASGAAGGSRSRTGPVRGVPFTAITEDWRLRGRMDIAGRLSDALNKREAVAITDVEWGPPDSTELEPAPGLKSVDPYDLILVTAGEDSLPPLTDTERAALKVHKVAYDVGYVGLTFTFRGCGTSTGDFSLQGWVDDLRAAIDYLTRERGHHRLVIDPAADNEAAIACYAKLGFRTVGRMHRSERGSTGDGWHDQLLMELVAPDPA